MYENDIYKTRLTKHFDRNPPCQCAHHSLRIAVTRVTRTGDYKQSHKDLSCDFPKFLLLGFATGKNFGSICPTAGIFDEILTKIHG